MGTRSKQGPQKQSSPARTAGKIYKDVVLAGHKLRLSQPKMAGVYAEMEAFIVARKDDPLVLATRACRRAPAEQHETIWRAAMEIASAARIATQDDWKRFQSSRWATAFLLWKALDPQHAEEFPTVESVMELIVQEAEAGGENLEEAIANAAVVQQDAELKNSSGPTGMPAPGRNRTTDDLSSEDGRRSTSTSPNDTA